MVEKKDNYKIRIGRFEDKQTGEILFDITAVDGERSIYNGKRYKRLGDIWINYNINKENSDNEAYTNDEDNK